ncbi:unnamed protein product, partial [Oppiella nova]
NKKWVESIYPGKRRQNEGQQDQLYERPTSLLDAPQIQNPSDCNRKSKGLPKREWSEAIYSPQSQAPDDQT